MVKFQQHAVGNLFLVLWVHVITKFRQWKWIAQLMSALQILTIFSLVSIKHLCAYSPGSSITNQFLYQYATTRTSYSTSPAIANGVMISTAHLSFAGRNKIRSKILRLDNNLELYASMNSKHDESLLENDRRFMVRALELAKQAKGQTFPNPCVGCVLVKDDQVVGEGYHPRAGMPHAEVLNMHTFH